MNNEKCVICKKEYDSLELWNSSSHPWMKICENCWELPFEEKQKKVREYAKKNKINETRLIEFVMPLTHEKCKVKGIEIQNKEERIMNNEEYINEIIDKLKDDRPIHAYSTMKRYLTYLGYTQPLSTTKFADFRNKFFENLDTKTGWEKEQLKKLFDDTYFELSNEPINWE